MRITLVTTNKGKAEEFSRIFKEYGVKFRIEPLRTEEIQSDDLEEIATHSVEYAYNILREPVIVEDAGLFIDALNGFPGPYSSYTYKTIGYDGILKLMEGVEDRRARFLSVLAFYSPLTELQVFKAQVKGKISLEPRGEKGFGFDPIFIPDEGDGKTFGELSPEEKNKFSHRGKSTRLFLEWFKERFKEVPPPYK